MNTGEIIKNFMQEKGITQVWLAKQLKISPQRLHYMLDKDLKFGQLSRICKELGISIKDIQKKEMLTCTAKHSSTSPQDNVT